MLPKEWEVEHNPPSDGDCGPASILHVLRARPASAHARYPATALEVRRQVVAFMTVHFAFFFALAPSLLERGTFDDGAMREYLNKSFQRGSFWSALELCAAASACTVSSALAW